MSSALALASVTAVLRETVHDALVDHDVSTIVPDAAVTAVAPDQITLGDAGPNGINVYLYGTSPNAGWRNAGLPSRNGRGARLSNPPLALDLHYLLTAYASNDFHAEVLLGVAMQRLHEVPVLDRATVRAVLQNGTILDGRLAGSALADQVELVKLMPEPMEAERVSKLWSAFQTSYRPSAAYRASVVLVEAEEPVRTPLPVLTRGPRDPVTGDERGVIAITGLIPPVPTLTGLDAPASQLAAQIGDAVVLSGHHLDGSGHRVTVSHTRFDAAHTLTPDAVVADAITVTVPTGTPAEWPAGLYTVEISLTRDGRDLTTNTLPLALAPTMDVVGVTVTLSNGTALIEVPVVPHVRPEQTASLVVGSREIPAEPITATTATLSFVMDDAEAGTYLARLRVDGVESVFIDRATSPPTFDPSQEVTLA
ncbi:DUF4255 domain-containing protein [Rubrivirga sp.]|uniref:DUF4255 domain-containing protein n=1 Tax=Rubrivirga sp. TaxID=1885344 RepID=UPI003B51D600